MLTPLLKNAEIVGNKKKCKETRDGDDDQDEQGGWTL